MTAPDVQALRDTLQSRDLPPVPVVREPRTPLARRRQAAYRTPPLPGLGVRELRGRDPLEGLADRLAVEVVGASACIVGVPRTAARDLALDAGLSTMFDPVLGEQVIRAAHVDRFVDHVLACGLTIVVRPEVAVV